MIPLPGSLGSPYLALKAGFFVDVLLRHPLQQLGLVLLKVFAQHRGHVALAFAMIVDRGGLLPPLGPGRGQSPG